MAVVVLVSPSLAQEKARDTGEKPPAVKHYRVLDAIGDLFGASTPEDTERPQKQSNPTVVAPPQPIVITGVIPNSSATPNATAPEANVKIQTTYAAAVREVQLHNRPRLVLLGARWCSWCRKLEAELETPEAKPIFAQWVIAEVDVDDEPEVAARLEASGLPGLRILGPFQAVVASREGYLETAELKQWLDENRKSADPAVFKILYDTTEPNAETLKQLIGLLTDTSPLVRGAAIERLAAHGRVSAGPMVQILKTGRLAQQLAACEVLHRWRAPVETIDPWQPDTLRGEQFVPLIDWARRRMDAGEAAIEPPGQSADVPTLDVQSASDLLQRLMKAEPADRPSLMAQLIGMGPPLVVEVRSRLAHADSLDDATRERLRELLYHLLASRQLRMEQTGVLAALARLDLESHRQAAATILDRASIVDQPLVEELGRDADPLVRELAVRSFGRLGLMNEKGRIQQLLNDSNSNVRTAVLRVLSEHPSDESVEILCEYLGKETDEDLLVHGTKCLGQLPRQPKAMTALARLAANRSWRVRATAIEVAGQAIQTRLQQPIIGPDGSRMSGVPPELADAILAAALEPDAFVAERAAKVLPNLIQEGGVDASTLDKIATALADHPEQFRLILERIHGEVGSIHRTINFKNLSPPLVRLAKAWLTNANPKETQRAVILLSQLAPTELNDRVGELIASNDATIRLAGLRAVLTRSKNTARRISTPPSSAGLPARNGRHRALRQNPSPGTSSQKKKCHTVAMRRRALKRPRDRRRWVTSITKQSSFSCPKLRRTNRRPAHWRLPASYSAEHCRRPHRLLLRRRRRILCSPVVVRSHWPLPAKRIWN